MKGTVAITGAGGIIGGIVRSRLLRDGWNVIGVDRASPKSQGGPGVDGGTLVDPSAVDRAVGDLSNRADTRGIFDGCSHVIHLAAQGSPDASHDDILQNNIIGTLNVLDEAERCKTVRRVVFASSNHTQCGAVIGKDAYYDPALLPNGKAMALDDRRTPSSFYGESVQCHDATVCYC